MNTTISAAHVRKAVGIDDIPGNILHRIEEDQLQYVPLTLEEYNQYLLTFLRTLDDDLIVAGAYRKKSWNSGWNENLQEWRQTGDLDSLIPKYHNKHTVAKLNGDIIHTITPWFDYKWHSYIVDTILSKHLDVFPAQVVEIGCGTGYHLFRQQQQFPQHNYLGLDFAKSSQQIIQGVNQPGVSGAYFDYLKPSLDTSLKDAVVYSVASLEQIGESYHEFLRYIIEQRPRMCIHLEPIAEVFNPQSNLLDYLHVKYIQKRKYLHGYLTTLRSLEALGLIRIHNVRRLHYGSRFLEGHTLIQWSCRK